MKRIRRFWWWIWFSLTNPYPHRSLNLRLCWYLSSFNEEEIEMMGKLLVEVGDIMSQAGLTVYEASNALLLVGTILKKNEG